MASHSRFAETRMSRFSGELAARCSATYRKISGWKRRRQLKKELPAAMSLLSSLLDAGIGIEQALDYTRVSYAGKPAQAYITALIAGVREGQPLSSIETDLIPAWLTVLMRTAEKSGEMAGILQNWSNAAEEEQTLMAGIKKKASYPLLLFAGTLLTIGVIGRLVLPQFQNMYSALGLKPPLSMSLFLGLWKHLPMLSTGAIGCLMFAFCALAWIRSRMPSAWEKWRKRIPGYRLLVTHRTYRLSFSLGALTSAGLPLADAAMEIHASSRNRWLQGVCFAVAEHVRAGQSLSQCFPGECHPILRLQLERAEHTGDLPDAFRKTHLFTRQAFIQSIEQLSEWMEPALSLVTGLIVGITIFTLYVPMYSLISDVGGL